MHFVLNLIEKLFIILEYAEGRVGNAKSCSKRK